MNIGSEIIICACKTFEWSLSGRDDAPRKLSGSGIQIGFAWTRVKQKRWPNKNHNSRSCCCPVIVHKGKDFKCLGKKFWGIENEIHFEFNANLQSLSLSPSPPVPLLMAVIYTKRWLRNPPANKFDCNLSQGDLRFALVLQLQIAVALIAASASSVCHSTLSEQRLQKVC